VGRDRLTQEFRVDKEFGLIPTRISIRNSGALPLASARMLELETNNIGVEVFPGIWLYPGSIPK
jgi:hypothetical protein